MPVNTFVGLLLVVLGALIILIALAQIVGEIISGKRSGGAAKATALAGFSFDGIAGIIKAIATMFEALSKLPAAAILIVLGLASEGFGVWILAAKPI